MSKKYSFVKKNEKGGHGMRDRTSMKGGAIVTLTDMITNSTILGGTGDFDVYNNYTIDYAIHAYTLEIARSINADIKNLENQIFVDFIKSVLEFADNVTRARKNRDTDFSSNDPKYDYNKWMETKIPLKTVANGGKSPFAGQKVSAFQILENDYENYFQKAFGVPLTAPYNAVARNTFKFVDNTNNSNISSYPLTNWSYDDEEDLSGGGTATPLFNFYFEDYDESKEFMQITPTLTAIENLRTRIRNGEEEKISKEEVEFTDPIVERERVVRSRGMAELRDKVIRGDIDNNFNMIQKSVSDIIGSLTMAINNVYVREAFTNNTPDISLSFDDIRISPSDFDPALKPVDPKETKSDMISNNDITATTSTPSKPTVTNLTNASLMSALGLKSGPSTTNLQPALKAATTAASSKIPYNAEGYNLLLNRIFRDHTTGAATPPLTIAAFDQPKRTSNNTAKKNVMDTRMLNFFDKAKPQSRFERYFARYHLYGGNMEKNSKYKFKVMDNYSVPQYGGNSSIKDVNDYDDVLKSNHERLSKIKDVFSSFAEIIKKQNEDFFDNSEVYDLRVVEARNQILVSNMIMYTTKIRLVNAGVNVTTGDGKKILDQMRELKKHLNNALGASFDKITKVDSPDDLLDLAKESDLTLSSMQNAFTRNSFVGSDGNPLPVPKIPDQPILSRFSFLLAMRQLYDTYGDSGITERLRQMVDKGVDVTGLVGTTSSLENELRVFYDKLKDLNDEAETNKKYVNIEADTSADIKKYTGSIIKSNLNMLDAFIQNLSIYANIYGNKMNMVKEIKQMSTHRKSRLDRIVSLMDNMKLDVKAIEPLSKKSGTNPSQLDDMGTTLGTGATPFKKIDFEPSAIFTEIKSTVEKISSSITNMYDLQDTDQRLSHINKDLFLIGTQLDRVIESIHYSFIFTNTDTGELYPLLFGKLYKSLQEDTNFKYDIIVNKLNYLDSALQVTNSNKLIEIYTRHVRNTPNLIRYITNYVYLNTEYFNDIPDINVPSLLKRMFSIANAVDGHRIVKEGKKIKEMIDDDFLSDDHMRKEISNFIRKVNDHVHMHRKLNNRVRNYFMITIEEKRKKVFSLWETFLSKNDYSKTELQTLINKIETLVFHQSSWQNTSIVDFTNYNEITDGNISGNFDAEVTKVKNQWNRENNQGGDAAYEAQIKKDVLEFIAATVKNAYVKLNSAYTSIASMAAYNGVPTGNATIIESRQKVLADLEPQVEIMMRYDSFKDMANENSVSDLLERVDDIILWLRITLNKVKNGDKIQWIDGNNKKLYPHVLMGTKQYNNLKPVEDLKDYTPEIGRLVTDGLAAGAAGDPNKYVQFQPVTVVNGTEDYSITDHLGAPYTPLKAYTKNIYSTIKANSFITLRDIKRLLNYYETVRLYHWAVKIQKSVFSVGEEYIELLKIPQNLYQNPSTVTIADGNKLRLSVINLAKIMKEYSLYVYGMDHVIPHIIYLIPKNPAMYYDGFISALEGVSSTTTPAEFATIVTRSISMLGEISDVTITLISRFVYYVSRQQLTNDLIAKIKYNVSHKHPAHHQYIQDTTAEFHTSLRNFYNDYTTVLKMVEDKFNKINTDISTRKIVLPSLKTPHYANIPIKYKDENQKTQKFIDIIMRSKNPVPQERWDKYMEYLGLVRQYCAQVSTQFDRTKIQQILDDYTDSTPGSPFETFKNGAKDVDSIKSYVRVAFLKYNNLIREGFADADNLSRACENMCTTPSHDTASPHGPIHEIFHELTKQRRLFSENFDQDGVATHTLTKDKINAVTDVDFQTAILQDTFELKLDSEINFNHSLPLLQNRTIDEFDTVLKYRIKNFSNNPDPIDKKMRQIIIILIGRYIRAMLNVYVNTYLDLRFALKKQVDEIVKDLDITKEVNFLTLLARIRKIEEDTIFKKLMNDDKIHKEYRPARTPANLAESEVPDASTVTPDTDNEKLQMAYYDYTEHLHNTDANRKKWEEIKTTFDRLLERYDNDLHKSLLNEEKFGRELNSVGITLLNSLKDDKIAINTRLSQLKTLNRVVMGFVGNKYYKAVDFVNRSDLEESLEKMLNHRTSADQLDKDKITEVIREESEYELARQQQISYRLFTTLMGGTMSNPDPMPGHDPIFDDKLRYTRMTFGLIEFYYDIIVSVVECLESKSHIMMNRIELTMYKRYYIPLKRCQKVFQWIVREYLPQKLEEESEKKRQSIQIKREDVVLRKKIYLADIGGEAKNVFKMFNALKDLLDDWRSAVMPQVSIHVRINDYDLGPAMDKSHNTPDTIKYNDYDPLTIDYTNHSDGLIFSVDRKEKKKLKVNLTAADHFFSAIDRGEPATVAYKQINSFMSAANHGIDVERIYDPVDFPEADIISNYMSLAANIKNGRGTCIMTYGYSGVGKTASLFGSGGSKGILQTTLDQLAGNKIYFRTFEIYGLGTSHNFYWNPKSVPLGSSPGTPPDFETYPNYIYQFLIHYKLDTSGNQLNINRRIILDNRADMFSYIGDMQRPVYDSAKKIVHFQKSASLNTDVTNGWTGTELSDQTTHYDLNASTYVELTRENYVHFDQFVEQIDKKRETEPLTVDKYFRHRLQQVKSTVNNPVSSRSILVYDFQIKIGDYFVPLVIYDLPGKEDLYKTFVEPDAAKVNSLEAAAQQAEQKAATITDANKGKVFTNIAKRLRDQKAAVLNDLQGDSFPVTVGGNIVNLKPLKSSLVMNPYLIADINFDNLFPTYQQIVKRAWSGASTTKNVNENTFVNSVLDLEYFPSEAAMHPSLFHTIIKLANKIKIKDMFNSSSLPTDIDGLFNAANLNAEVVVSDKNSQASSPSTAGNIKYGIITLATSTTDPPTIPTRIHRAIFIAVITQLISYKMFDVLVDLIKTAAANKVNPGPNNWVESNIYSPFEAFFINENVVGLLHYLIKEILDTGIEPFQTQQDHDKEKSHQTEHDFILLKQFFELFASSMRPEFNQFNMPGITIDTSWFTVSADDPRKDQKQQLVDAVLNAFEIDKNTGIFIKTGKTLAKDIQSMQVMQDIRNRLIYDNNKIFRNGSIKPLRNPHDQILNDKGVPEDEKNYPLIRDFLEPYRAKTELYYLFFVVSNMQRSLKSEEQIKLVENSMPFITALASRSLTGEKKTLCVPMTP